jgi:hypothetical protein
VLTDTVLSCVCVLLSLQAFMVGDRVDVHSRSAKGGDATIWSSDGSGQFTVKTVPAEVSANVCFQIIVPTSQQHTV